MSKNLLALKKRRRKFLELEKGIVILERLLITRLRELSLPRLSEYSSHVISLRWRIGFVGVLFSPEKRAERFRKVVENRKERKLLVQRHIANREIFLFAGRRKSGRKREATFSNLSGVYTYVCISEEFYKRVKIKIKIDIQVIDTEFNLFYRNSILLRKIVILQIIICAIFSEIMKFYKFFFLCSRLKV